MSLVSDPNRIRIAMIGMVEGNGHPFSWSAIINGDYDAAAMAACGYPAIPEYLGAQPREALGIPGAQVTHVWCDQLGDAKRVAEAAHIPHVVDSAEDVIGQVDAVIISTDIGHEHLDRARPFIDAGLPLFIDKPLCDREDHLQRFARWHAEGRAFLSTSCMRYAQEYRAIRDDLSELGDLRLVTITMAKTWERYGIHALEAVYAFARPGGYDRVSLSSTSDASIVHITHKDGVHFVITVVDNLTGAFGHLTAHGTKGSRSIAFSDTFAAFKSQLEAFIAYLRSGKSPVEFSETVEQMKIIIAGIHSREQNGQPVFLTDIKVDTE